MSIFRISTTDGLLASLSFTSWLKDTPRTGQDFIIRVLQYRQLNGHS